MGTHHSLGVEESELPPVITVHTALALGRGSSFCIWITVTAPSRAPPLVHSPGCSCRSRSSHQVALTKCLRPSHGSSLSCNKAHTSKHGHTQTFTTWPLPRSPAFPPLTMLQPPLCSHHALCCFPAQAFAPAFRCPGELLHIPQELAQMWSVKASLTPLPDS